MAFARKWLSWFRHDTRPLQVCQRLDQTPLKQHFPFSQQKCSDKRAFDRHFPGFISKTALVWAVFCTTSGSKTHSTASSLPSRVQHQSKLTHNGNCCLWAKIKPDWPNYQGKNDDWSMTNYLIDRVGVGSAPGSAFGPAGAGHIRFAFSCSTEQVREAAGLIPTALRAAGG